MAPAVWLIVANLLAFAAFGYDKSQARRDGPRIPERRLILIAFLGGWPGAKLGQRYFRHKTVKQPFVRDLNLVPVAWAVLAAVLGYVYVGLPA